MPCRVLKIFSNKKYALSPGIKRLPVVEIPTYLADGTRCTRGEYPLKRVMRLHATGRVSLEFKGKRVIAAHYRQDSGETSIVAQVPTGTKYSFPERLPDTAFHVWTHKALPNAETGCDLFVRRIFRQVTLDCISDNKPPAKTAILDLKKAA